MNEAAEAVMRELPDLVLAYGNSDEFRYVDTANISVDFGADSDKFCLPQRLHAI